MWKDGYHDGSYFHEIGHVEGCTLARRCGRRTVFRVYLPSFIFVTRHRYICIVLLNSILLLCTKFTCIFNKCAITYFVPTAFIYESRSTTEYLKILNVRLLYSDLVLRIIFTFN